MRLLGKDSAKAVDAAFCVACQIHSGDGKIAEYKRLWEKVKISLPDEPETYTIANDLGAQMWMKGKHGEARAFYIAALEGRRRLLGEEHKESLGLLNNLGMALSEVKDYEGAIEYYQQALTVQEKVLGKTHPDTLATIENMATTNMEGFMAHTKGFTDLSKSEGMFRLALSDYEKSMGKEHERTKTCAKNFAALLGLRNEREKMREQVKEYVQLLSDFQIGHMIRDLIK